MPLADDTQLEPPLVDLYMPANVGPPPMGVVTARNNVEGAEGSTARCAPHTPGGRPLLMRLQVPPPLVDL
jgi:hypothetical protein